MTDTHDIAILAGGCFWTMQHLLRGCRGVVASRVGYTGGDTHHPTSRNRGLHAEAVEVIFDPAVTSFRALLQTFFQSHDPTTKDRQGDDVGPAYRSAVFYTSEAQRLVAVEVIGEIEALGVWPDRIVTEVTAASTFWEAEAHHQNFLER